MKYGAGWGLSPIPLQAKGNAGPQKTLCLLYSYPVPGHKPVAHLSKLNNHQENFSLIICSTSRFILAI